jgi:hypothetical protein
MTLIERLEQAEAGSRELDAEIAKTRFGDDAVRYGGAGWPEGAIIVPCYPGWQIMPYYSTSIDAAQSLVPDEFKDDWSLIGGKYWQAEVGFELCDAATPALALAIASLKAAGYE